MRCVLFILLLSSACAGPSQQALAETPTATTKRTPAEAPAASGPEKERERMIQANDQMTDADNAHREAGNPPESPVPAAKPKTKPAAPVNK